MLYGYKCNVCSAEVDQVRTIAQRDEERPCPQVVKAEDGSEPTPCPGVLVRTAEVEVTSNMKMNWAVR